MGDDKIDSFKIGDTHRDGMSAPAQRGGSDVPEEATQSMGFARIESLLENEDPVEVGENLNQLLVALEELAGGADGKKQKLALQRATAAVERAVDLLDFLFQTKTAMSEEAQAPDSDAVELARVLDVVLDALVAPSRSLQDREAIDPMRKTVGLGRLLVAKALAKEGQWWPGTKAGGRSTCAIRASER